MRSRLLDRLSRIIATVAVRHKSLASRIDSDLPRRLLAQNALPDAEHLQIEDADA